MSSYRRKTIRNMVSFTRNNGGQKEVVQEFSSARRKKLSTHNSISSANILQNASGTYLLEQLSPTFWHQGPVSWNRIFVGGGMVQAVMPAWFRR